MHKFDVVMKSRVIFSAGSSEKVGKIGRDWNVHRVLLVTDAGITKAGLHNGLCESLRNEGIEIILFSHVEPNPTTDNVEQGVQVARTFSPDMIVALGGGSSLDAEKRSTWSFAGEGRSRTTEGC
jgi:alcohol dehydrogenase class IV